MKKTFLKLSAASIGALHCVNKYIDNSVSNNTKKIAGKKYCWKNGNIFYRVAGKGEPVLLLHNLNVFCSENDWNQVLPLLAETNRVYTPDLIGCGRSDKPSETYTGYFYVQMITDFVKNVIGERTTVVASGINAVYVMMANSLDEDLFDQIILINPPSLSSLKKMPDQHSKILLRLFGLPVIGKTCYYIAVNKTNTEDYFSEKVFFNPFQVKQQTVKAGYQAAHTGNGGGRYLFASLEGGYLNADPTEVIRKNNKNVTLVVSEHLPGAREITEKYMALNDSIQTCTLKNTKMLPELEAPELVATTIKKIMDKCENI